MTGEKQEEQREDKEAASQAWRNHPIGYPRLSERMGVKPETLIFRKFVALNARMLLYMQAELAVLEKTLQEKEQADRNNRHGNKRSYATDYTKLSNSHLDGDTSQQDLITDIGTKLEKYNKALLRQHQLHTIPEPDPFDLNDIYCLLYSDDMGGGELAGVDALFWGSPDDSETHAPDLIGVCPRDPVDPFTRFVSENGVHLFKYGLGRLKKPDKFHGRCVYYDETVLKLTSWATCVLASLLPVASVLVLIYLHSSKTKLWVIAVFNLLASACLKTCTNVRGPEIFAVTAAFAAVQMVFVGTKGDRPVP